MTDEPTEADTTTTAAMQIARVVYGSIPPEGPLWDNCLRAVGALKGGLGLAKGEIGRYGQAQISFEKCKEFNKKFPLGTQGSIGGQRTSVEAAACVFPHPLASEVVMAWFAGLGWRHVDRFEVEEKTYTVSDELLNIGRTFNQQNRPDLAENLFHASLIADPSQWQVMNELGVLCANKRDNASAVDWFTKALDVNPRIGEILNNRSLAFRSIGRKDEAMRDAREAMLMIPGNEQIVLNAALTADDMDEVDECLRILDEALIRHPDKITTQYNRSLVLLSAGRLKEGWESFGWRLEQPSCITHYEHFDIPVWNGESIEGKDVLIWGEQGVGDEIMTASMIPDVVKVAKRVTVLATTRLVSVFRRAFSEITVDIRPPVAIVEAFQRKLLSPEYQPDTIRNGHFDVQLSQRDLGLMFRSSFSTFPNHSGYLVADEMYKRAARQKCEDTSNPQKLVGISWNSDKNIRIGYMKGMRLRDLAPVLKIPGITFVSLQYGDNSKEIADVEAEFGVKIVPYPGGDAFENIEAFFGAVAAMDLVISVSNTTIHAAGSMGIPTWAMIADNPGRLWYMFRNRTDCPWYPSLKLFRQEAVTQWQPVVERIAAELQEWAK